MTAASPVVTEQTPAACELTGSRWQVQILGFSGFTPALWKECNGHLCSGMGVNTLGIDLGQMLQQIHHKTSHTSQWEHIVIK